MEIEHRFRVELSEEVRRAVEVIDDLLPKNQWRSLINYERE